MLVFTSVCLLLLIYIVFHIYRLIKLLPFIEDPQPLKKVRPKEPEIYEEPVKKAIKKRQSIKPPKKEPIKTEIEQIESEEELEIEESLELSETESEEPEEDLAEEAEQLQSEQDPEISSFVLSEPPVKEPVQTATIEVQTDPEPIRLVQPQILMVPPIIEYIQPNIPKTLLIENKEEDNSPEEQKELPDDRIFREKRVNGPQNQFLFTIDAPFYRERLNQIIYEKKREGNREETKDEVKRAVSRYDGLMDSEGKRWPGIRKDANYYGDLQHSKLTKSQFPRNYKNNSLNVSYGNSQAQSQIKPNNEEVNAPKIKIKGKKVKKNKKAGGKQQQQQSLTLDELKKRLKLISYQTPEIQNKIKTNLYYKLSKKSNNNQNLQIFGIKAGIDPPLDTNANILNSEVQQSYDLDREEPEYKEDSACLKFWRNPIRNIYDAYEEMYTDLLIEEISMDYAFLHIDFGRKIKLQKFYIFWDFLIKVLQIGIIFLLRNMPGIAILFLFLVNTPIIILVVVYNIFKSKVMKIKTIILEAFYLVIIIIVLIFSLNKTTQNNYSSQIIIAYCLIFLYLLLMLYLISENIWNLILIIDKKIRIRVRFLNNQIDQLPQFTVQ